MEKHTLPLYQSLSNVKDPEFILNRVSDDDGSYTLKNNHYYFFLKWSFDTEDTPEIRKGQYFYGKFQTPDKKEDSITFNPNEEEDEEDEEDEEEEEEGRMVDLQYLKNAKLTKVHNKNEMVFFKKKNKLKYYNFYIIENYSEEEKKQKQAQISLIKQMSNRLDNVDLLPFLYNMPQPKQDDNHYNMLKKEGVLLNNYVQPVTGNIRFPKKIEDAIKKPTQQQVKNLFRYLETKRNITKKRSKLTGLRHEIKAATLNNKKSINELKSRIDSLEKEFNNSSITKLSPLKIGTRGGKTKRNKKRRNTKKYRIENVTTHKTPKKRG